MTVLESCLRDFKYEMPGIGVHELQVDRALLESPENVLKEFANRGQNATREEAMRELASFIQKFNEQNGVELKFSESAIQALVNKHEEEGQSLLKISRRLFKDYPYGVKLIKSKTGNAVFEITEEAVSDPDGFLSSKVLLAYDSERG